MILREYQQKLIDELFEKFGEGYKAPCIVLPCGGGKSIIVAAVAKRFTDEGKTVLFLVHRRELCEQIERTFRQFGVDMKLCGIVMVQTMARRLRCAAAPDLIITDENHHSLAATYKKIYEAFPDSKRVGVTATPERTDGSGLIDVNDYLITGVTAKWLIENKYLSPYDYYGPNIKMPKFRVKRGDFDLSQIADFFNRNAKKIYGDTLKHYRRLACGKQAICYLPSIEISKEIAAKFTADGITAAHIDGDTPKPKRDKIIEEFRDGRIKILCNVDIISEGFDVPDCECVILLRPTKSLILFIQQSMRCMRYKEGKRAIIIDHVNNIGIHGFPDTEREWTLEGHKKKKNGGEAPLKTCPECFACVPISTKICPHCEHEFEFEENTKKHDEKYQLVKLNEAENRVKFYLSSSECQNVEELKIYAKQHGYKPGWVYYQQKARGWLGGGQKGNTNTKRYPCRAV